MKNENNIKTFRQWIKCHQDHNIDGMLEFLTEDVSITSAAGGKMPPGTNKAEAAHHWQTIYSTFNDMHLEEIHLTSEDDIIFAEVEHGGTMNGPMGDMPATGAKYKVQGAFRFEFEDGKIKSIFTYWDPSSMLMQLGLIPSPELQE